MFLLGLYLCLGIVNGIIPETSKTAVDIIANVETKILEETTLNEKVEEPREDTQQKLDDAEHLMDNETAGLNPNVSSNPQNESAMEINAGNQSTYITEMTNKTTDNVTDEMTISKETQSSHTSNSIDHECVIGEDCGEGKFCLYETRISKCLPCKELDATCSKDEECCAGQLCVWGQCAQNSTKGDAGTVCQHQSDCKEEFCCALHKALLFPVCIPKPIERERCIISAHHLMGLLSWDMDVDGPQEHCPCVGKLQCQHLGRGALCLKSPNSSEEDLADELYSEVDYIV
ncbi:dickkopf-related protein 3a [Paramisgurnus dabryanus]|uniref:dickkopf-related protein 3a n=1 Tax=Paramisgurnus dabryanus TaxID=90735 RepID=UPI0031F37E1A